MWLTATLKFQSKLSLVPRFDSYHYFNTFMFENYNLVHWLLVKVLVIWDHRNNYFLKYFLFKNILK
jgi:hypothetical protein